MTKWLAFWVLVLIYGSGFMFIDIALDQISPIHMNTIRFVVGASFLVVILYARGGRIPTDWQTLKPLIIIGIMNNTVPFLLVAWAQLKGVDSGLTGVLIATNPLFALVLAHFYFADERMTTPKVIGVTVGFVGVLVLASRNFEDGQLVTDGLVGQLAIITAAFLFAATATYSRRVMQDNIQPLVVATTSSVVAAISLLILTLITTLTGDGMLAFDQWESDTVLAIAVLVVNNTVIAFLLLFYVIQELGVTRSSIIAYLVPVVSLSLGVLFRDEQIDAKVLLGTGIILSSIVIANFSFNRKRQQVAISSSSG